ncbi:MAG TPA: hypothetical protein GX696_05350 [Pseudomonadaceae bacterium]|nr:hypothetical protein [Pseudomonadaceae bacterium]
MGLCIDSVAQWAAIRGYEHRLVGDEIFDLVPDWYRTKVGRKLPVATDYARLLLLQQALEEGYDQVIWLDADVLVFDDSLSLEFSGSCAFGQEVWVQEVDGRYAAHRNVHNAVCAFRQGCVVLPFLIHTVLSIMRRVHPEHIAPQLVGPKLLTALHSICGFELLPQVGALSPDVTRDMCAGGGLALDLLRRKSEHKPKAVNLCASLIDDAAAEIVIATLLPAAGAASTGPESTFPESEKVSAR